MVDNPKMWILGFGCLITGACLLLAISHFLKRLGSQYIRKASGQFDYELPKHFVFIGADRLLTANVITACIAVCCGWLLTQSIVMTAFIAVVCGLFPSLFLDWLKKRRFSLMASQFPEFAALLASSLRAGSSIQVAMTIIAEDVPDPLKQEIKLLLREQKLGLSLDDAILRFSQRSNIEDFSLLCAAIRISRISGGNLADTLDSLSAASRRRLALEAKIESLTAQGKLQGWVMAALPLFLTLVLFQIEPRAMQPLVSTWYGWLVVATVASLQMLGLHFIRRIVNIDI